MNNQKRLEELNRLQELYESYKREESKIENILPYFQESPFIGSVDYLLDFLIDRFAERWNIPVDALIWHIYENEWGVNKSGMWEYGAGGTAITNNKEFLSFSYLWTTASGGESR